ncbi:3-hydroxyacyl-CoA dehydrogenase/crotonase FadB [Staphylococcus delphini]|uniref:3-hydroxyacyl-CoA dehydrogenase/crotonase FadB n=1 Tax=Staphylococcus delphini TaxID=53344 RepID=UPI0021D13307|nr:3-hydroxyacyl-CoA dehydrogenase/enoyl-CoA hydratase family protein [Staphylococcus delphini]UXS21908.1 3-hydroxyacyl-CoA dehydrogenase/enoyl-CoA hydratase family protein [Staphylococcus delphini]UXS57849.1 3-hydroxyacyl-CoA dehydrogenase/enoyl-CoA hydratase family protein [Staphylococcus delphini]
MTIRKVTVLGAGTMGAQLAAVLVNAGLKVKLLDIVIDDNDPNKISKAAYEKITHPKKPLLFDLALAPHLTYGNFQDDLADDDADLYLEAVKEDLEVKRQLWQQVAKTAKPEALFATNTSGIPIEAIAKVFSPEDKKRFFGLHFFNPPRIMKLVELIPNAETDPTIIDNVQTFTQEVLGKGVIVVNDVPGFVANRIGTQTMNDIMYRAEQQGFSITEVDALTGKIIGRPKTGTYALSDLVGLDIAVSVIRGLQQVPEEAPYFHDIQVVNTLYEAGALGRKTKQGFYKKDRKHKQRLVYDVEQQDYVPVTQPELPILASFNKDLAHNLDVIFNATDTAGQFLWETLRNNFYYAALNVPKATDDFRDIDRALVWGFNWKLGPFQLWDLMGFDRVKMRIEAELGTLPEWIQQIDEGFYGECDTIEYVTPIEHRLDKILWQRRDSQLAIVNDKQLLLKLRSQNNVITDAFNDDLVEAIDLLENEPYSSMVIYADGPHFSVGANLYEMKKAHETGQVDELIAPAIDQLHASFNRLKYSEKPVVTAIQGRVLGGGCELVLHSPFVVASSETYIGLVEAGVGLLPSGGGLAEMSDRILQTSHMMNDKQASMTEVLMTIGLAKVSTNAFEARRYGFLRPTDTIIFNQERRVEIALQRAQFEADAHYMPTPKRQYIALGQDFLALAQGQLDAQRLGHYISDHDYNIALRIATVLSGGDLPRNTYINQRYIQKLEKVHFLELIKAEKTYERIAYMLKHGKPLRN